MSPKLRYWPFRHQLANTSELGLGKNAFAFIKYDDQFSATHAIDSEVDTLHSVVMH